MYPEVIVMNPNKVPLLCHLKVVQCFLNFTESMDHLKILLKFRL